jgi:TonB family protein
MALAHEWSHIQRRDLHTQLLAQLVCCLYWFQPLVWLAARRLRQEREQACDDAVLAGGVKAHEYAAELMELARAATRSPLGALAMAEVSDLEGRVRALLDRRRNRGGLGVWRGLAVAGVFSAILVPMAVLRAQSPAGPALLTGFVHDGTGARVPGASVTAHPMDGAESNQITTRTDAVGAYRFPLLPQGQYLLEFSVPGFAAAKREVTLAAGQTAQLDIALTVGSVQEAIVVKGKRPASASAVPAGPPRRIRVGGNVQAAKLIVQVPPEYPPDLQQAGIETSVTIKALISTTGEPMNLEVVSPGGDPRLVRAALDAVKQWRYQPARLNGEPVVIDTQITVDFRLAP